MLMTSPAISAAILREYDIRGIVGQDLTVDTAYCIGRGFGTHLIRSGGRRVCVGYDGRLSSPELESSLCHGLMDAGIEIFRVGLGPSPLVYFTHKMMQDRYPTDGAIMVTGSHNGPTYNGFKMMMFGASFFGADIQALGALINAGDFVPKSYGSLENIPAMPHYIAHLKGAYDGEVDQNDGSFERPTDRPLRIAIDPGNGAMCEPVVHLKDQLPHTFFLINETVDGTFPAHHPDPTIPSNLIQLQRLVMAERCDLGIAFDGDGDRIGVIDDEGHIIWGDQLLLLYAQDILRHRPGAKIIVDIKASDTVMDGIRKGGGQPMFSPSGHSIIKSRMALENAPLAGEMSGHMFFADRHAGYDDALYAAIRLMGYRLRSGAPLSMWRKGLPATFSTPELRFATQGVPKSDLIAAIKAALAGEGIAFLDIDGVRATWYGGWWLLRASNTADEFVMRFESPTADALEMMKNKVRSYLNPFGLSF